MKDVVLIPMPLVDFQSLINEAITKALKQERTEAGNPFQHLPDFLTRREAAKILNLSLTSLDYIVKDGRLKKHKNGRFVRFKKDEVLNFYKSYAKYSRA